MRVHLTYDAYLAVLLSDLATAGERLTHVASNDREQQRAAAIAASAHASARLDGSPLEPVTAAAVDAGEPSASVIPQTQGSSSGGLAAAVPGGGGWAAALRLEGMATQDVAAIEYANLRSVAAAQEELAPTLFDDPLATLTRLHGLICQGLVAPDIIGRPRRTDQAVHDGAQGMVIYNPAEPDAIPGLLDELATWLRGSGAREGSAALPTPVVAAVVHERLLQWQPYEAGNGRLARAAAALVLRARGLDRHGLLVPETFWAADPVGYYYEIAATMRRRDDLTQWVQRHTEVLLAAAHAALREAGDAPDPGPRARVAADLLARATTITVREYAQRFEVSQETAMADLQRLAVWGAVVREPRTLGRRFRRV